jgi:hypothetical protein
MPYIITTKSRVKVTRRAVATLDEAQDGCYWIAVDHGTTSEGAASIAIPHDGGTIGPLPDGTVIEVERVSLAALAAFTLTIELGNEAMQTPSDVAEALEDIARYLRANGLITNGAGIRDANGNTVGYWEFI